jgi:MFS family permease
MLRDPFRRSQLAIAALFCFLGFQYGTWVSRVPALKSSLDLSTAEVGLLLLATGVGAAVSFPLVARLMRQLGSARLARWAALGLIVVLPALAVTPSYPVALAVLLVDGVLIACLNVAMNDQGAALEAKYQRNTMARFHAVFSAGMFGAALLASGVTAVSPSLPVHFGIGAVLLLALLACCRTGLLAHEPVPAAEPGVRKRRTWVVPALITVLLGLALIFGEITEGAMNDWSALYLKDTAGASAAVAPLGIAVVSAMMVLARLFADGWRARFGDKRVVVIGAALAGIGLGGALLIGGVVPALIGFACVGLGMAAVTPCLYVAAAAQGPDALTLFAATGTIGLLAGPPVIGFIANGAGLTWGMAAVAVSAVLVSILVSRVRWPAPATANAPEAVLIPEG